MLEIERFGNCCVVKRQTNETSIILKLCTDNVGVLNGGTNIGFFDHLLKTFAKYSELSIEISEFQADTYVDLHHGVEDIGIVLGIAFRNLFDYNKVARFGYTIIPMDETLILSSVDLSGRQYLNFDVNFSSPYIGDFSTELVEEFFRAFVNNSAITLHIKKLEGKNNHHIAECTFKSVALSLKMALRPSEVSFSTKGVIM
ncbi:imidazoleglycerol-phosphate dehydratase HisB [Fervidobacterium pennivorans subsp. carthaginiensis]|uniref:imidazoleglycerol-phosphate dehydratase HisB n=1 Tax=Fervidobacterium pennivorans TaxID=93466 RepID=UPI00355C471D